MTATIQTIPEHLRDWNVPWPEYSPVDVGRPWDESTEPLDPRDINWDDRRAKAAVPFDLDEDGLPLNPLGRTGKIGLGEHLWFSENLCADMIVVAPSDDPIGDAGIIERSDRGTNAFPGGHVDPGENPRDAAVRELREETGLTVTGTPENIGLFVVDDPRKVDWAWRSTYVYVITINEKQKIVGMDDARDAKWCPATKLHRIIDPAHRPILDTFMSWARKNW